MRTGLPCDLSRGLGGGRGGGVAPPAGQSRLPLLSTREIRVYLRFISSVKPVGRSVSKAASQEVALLWKFASVEAVEPPPRTLGLSEKKEKKTKHHPLEDFSSLAVDTNAGPTLPPVEHQVSPFPPTGNQVLVPPGAGWYRHTPHRKVFSLGSAGGRAGEIDLDFLMNK